jgi:CHAD domain-containing protein
MDLELSLDPDVTTRLSRLPLLTPLRSGKPRNRTVRIIWHDSAVRTLANEGLVLAEQRPIWRLERLIPGGSTWPPGAPPPIVATGRSLEELDHHLPSPLVPVAAFEGRARTTDLVCEQGPVVMTLLTGTVRAVAGEQRVSRLHLEGAVQPVQALALGLAGEIGLSVPRACLAAEALAIMSGVPPAPRHNGAPVLPTGCTIAEAFAHTVGHLTDVILHFAPAAAARSDGPEPVHQMRVAVRRLRSAIKVFLRAVRSPEVDMADAGLKALAARLGPTRDWDVFVTETFAIVADAFPDDKHLKRLLAAAERRRRACHGELRTFLSSVDFHRLGIELACLAGGTEWQETLGEAEQAELALSLEQFASKVLDRRLKRLDQVESTLAELEPSALHSVRLCAKRLRYAAEIFTPLYPGKATNRYLRRLSNLQDRLGTLNDASVARDLLGELGGSHGNQAFASGLVLGFSGAHGGRTRGRIDAVWQKFRRQTPFWE